MNKREDYTNDLDFLNSFKGANKMNKELGERIFKVGNELYIKSIGNIITKIDCLEVATKLGKLADKVRVLEKRPRIEVVENMYEYIVKINGRARAVSKRCFKMLEELIESE